MAYFLITWNIGYGENEDVIEVEEEKEACEIAYANAHDDFESNVDYKGQSLTSELCEEYGYDPTDYGLKPVKYDD